MKKEKRTIVYQTKGGAIELKGDFEKDTVWATQAQIANLFVIDRTVVSKHIANIIKDRELDGNSVCAKFAHTAEDGKNYQVQFYNLDVVLAVGYRTNSAKAIEFRQWATKTLRQHIVQGYTINKKRLVHNYDSFLKAVGEVQKLLPAGGNMSATDTLDLVKMFASTWFSLDAYDKSEFSQKGLTKKQVDIVGEDLVTAIQDLKNELKKKKEASELFGSERSRGTFTGIIGNVLQSFGGQDLYPTIEEKATHLLYFIVKNHPFADGNKRSGAFAFVWFLQKTKLLNSGRMTPEALTALTLLIAESKPSDKERMIGLVLMLLNKN